MNTPFKTLCMLITLLLAAAPQTGCGDEDTPAQSNINNTDDSPEDNNDPNNTPNNQPDPNNDPQDPDPPANNDPPDDDNACPPQTLTLQSIGQQNTYESTDDTDPVEPGVQIQLQVQTNLPAQTLVTIENLTNQTSIGALTQSNTQTINGITLTPGTNTLRAVALTQQCLATSASINVELAPSQNCQEDAQCPDGQLCAPEDNMCAACQSECTQDSDCDSGRCIQGCYCEAPAFGYVLIEDQTPNASGNSPGADVDAVSILKGGDEFFASNVEDFNIDHPDNLFNDPTQILGPPDAQCQVQNFLSLGGSQIGGYVIVSFERGGQSVGVENGDSIKVYEIGALLCGRFDDDPYSVSVSASTDQGSFIELGQGGAGSNTIPVSGLP